MNDPQTALESSVARLRRIVEALDENQYNARAYPTEWTVADVMSHIGSGAVIMKRGIEASAGGTSVPDGFNQSVWDVWNAKAPGEQVADALAADQALLDTISGLTPDQRSTVRLDIGPMSLDLDGFVSLRLGEHALHTWDIEVAIDPTATVPGESAGIVAANLPMLSGFAGKPDGVERSLSVQTSDPALGFVLTTSAERVALEPAGGAAKADLTIPTEALVRLVSGRLDPDHTPAGVDELVVAPLRAVFPGF